MAVVGILMALLERNRTGKGQIVEIDMVSCRSRNRTTPS
jgi:crotonobetainyl-CoA:carnitine CoA-transferase CaiB-like acyl-CoA transferase